MSPQPSPTGPFNLSSTDRASAVHAHLFSPVFLSIVVLLAIFASQIVIFFFLTTLAPLPSSVEVMLNTLILSFTLAPLLFLLVYKPFKRYIEDYDHTLRSLTESEQRFHDIAEHAKEWIWEVDANGKFTYSSSVVEKILGYTSEEVVGKHFYDFFHPDEKEVLKQEAFEVFAAKMPFTEFINRNNDKNGMSVWLATSGIPILDENGELLGYRGADAVKHEESAITDVLTGVLNRRGFYLLAGQQIRMAIRNNLCIVILFADMDNLKQINDELGHLEGDRALVEMANVLKDSVRETDIVARYGGDEFVVLLTDITTTNVEQIVLRNIEKHIEAFNSTYDRRYTLSISVGFSAHDTEDMFSIDELILHADNSMYKRKRASRGDFMSTSRVSMT